MTDYNTLPLDENSLYSEFSKEQLIEIHKLVRGYVGDTARTSKQDYAHSVALEAEKDAPKVREVLIYLFRPEVELPAHDPAAVQAVTKAVKAAHTPPQPSASMQQPQVPQPQALTALMTALQALMGTQGSGIDETRVRAIIAEQLANLPPKVIEVRSPEPVELKEHVHPIFEKCLRLLTAGQNILLKGPAGCGKTFLAQQLARALKLKFGAISGSAGASESHLSGWLLPIGEGGKFEYVPSQFVTMYEQGNGVFLKDEIDAFDPNMLLQSNMATANGHFFVPQRYLKPLVTRGDNFKIIAAANTYGVGADALYVGRNQLDAATLDRYYVVEMDYDMAFEATLATADVAAWIWAIRDKAQQHKLRRVISTRAFQKAALAVGAGLRWKEVQQDLLAGWSKDELQKVGVQS